jgi:hypothetical protein
MISDDVAIRIAAATAQLDVFVTDFTGTLSADDHVEIPGEDTAALQAAGVQLEGSKDCTIILWKHAAHYGHVRIINEGQGQIILLGKQPGRIANNIVIRLKASRAVVLFPEFSVGITLPEVCLRSDDQMLFWGRFATSVWSRIEIEGAGRMIAIGDDCMLSSGVWLRNHDMHVFFDVETGVPFNADVQDIIVERHVWFGFESYVSGGLRIGYGSILGSRSFVKEPVPCKALVVGAPGRVVRAGVSWGREASQVPRWLKGEFARVERLGGR